MTQVEIALAIVVAMQCAFMLSMWSDIRRAKKRLRLYKKFLTKALERVETAPTHEEVSKLLTREGAEKLVSRVDVLSKDFMLFKQEFAGLSRQANALGMRKVASGVLPQPKDEAA